MRPNHINHLLSAALVLLLSLVACKIGQPGATETPQVTQVPAEETPVIVQSTETLRPTIAHLVTPGELPNTWLSEITDRDNSTVASEKRVIGGENYNQNLFERPFNADAMDEYYPDLDITRARLFEDSQWGYVSILFSGLGDDSVLGGSYGVEVDLDLDGRGDFLVFTGTPGASWSTEGVRVWIDDNNDVGGDNPIQSDPPPAGDGYETLAFDSGIGTDPDLAWSRLDPLDEKIVQIAFKISLLNAGNKFMWGAWADRGILNPAWYDYNDHFTAAEAGSPLIESADYPIKALYGVDNTCRWVVGFTPTGAEPGICPVQGEPVPVETPGFERPVYSIAYISGYVFDDWTNGDLVLDPDSGRIEGAFVHARAGACGIMGGAYYDAYTNSSGWYTIAAPPGTYCVYVYPDPVSYDYKTAPQTVTVTDGMHLWPINFGYTTKLTIR